MKFFAVFALFLSFTAAADSAVTDCSSVIGNFHKVSDGIYRGARPVNAASVECLKNLGIKKVIDLQGGDYSNYDWMGPKPWWMTLVIPYWEKGETPKEIIAEEQMVTENGMEFVPRPLDSMSTVVSNLQSLFRTSSEEERRIKDILKTIDESAKAKEPVFVHCASGNDRTGLIVALYRVKYEGIPFRTAYQEMHDLGHSYTHLITTWPMDLYFFQAVSEKWEN